MHILKLVDNKLYLDEKRLSGVTKYKIKSSDIQGEAELKVTLIVNVKEIAAESELI